VTPLTPDQQALAADPRTLAYALGVVRPYARRHPRLADEFESAALCAVVRAAGTYRPPAPFLKYWLPLMVRQACVQTLRDWMPKGYRKPGRRDGMPVVQTMDTFSRTTGSEYSRFDKPAWDQVPAGDDPVGWGAEYQDWVAAVARHGTPRQAEALLLYYSRAGATYARVAAALGVSERVAYELAQKAVGWARRDAA